MQSEVPNTRKLNIEHTMKIGEGSIAQNGSVKALDRMRLYHLHVIWMC